MKLKFGLAKICMGGVGQKPSKMPYHVVELRGGSDNEGQRDGKGFLLISRTFQLAAREATLKPAPPAICKSSVKWKVLIMRQIIKQGQPNCLQIQDLNATDVKMID